MRFLLLPLLLGAIWTVFAPAGASRAQSGDDLVGTVWHLVSLGRGDLLPPVVAGTEVTLELSADGRIAGSGGCNSYGATYQVNGNRLTVSPIMGTLMACGEVSVMEQESAYFDALQAAATYTVMNGNLIIVGADDQKLVYSAEPQAERVIPLTDTLWQLVSIASVPVLEGSGVTLQLSTDGSAAGSGGCNSYGATYQVDGNRLTVSPIMGTLMACGEVGVMEQESAYFDALQTATGYRLSGNELVVTFGDGQELVFNTEDAGQPTSDSAAQLPGTRWALTALGTEPVTADTDLTLEFGMDKHAGGRGGCNAFYTTYAVEGSNLTFTPLASTRRNCESAVMAQETAYFNGLNTANRYALADDQLTLSTSDGQTLTFVRLSN